MPPIATDAFRAVDERGRLVTKKPIDLEEIAGV